VAGSRKSMRGGTYANCGQTRPETPDARVRGDIRVRDPRPGALCGLAWRGPGRGDRGVGLASVPTPPQIDGEG
jgi:hypothetical protein